jgi:hypothetical protein
MTKTYADFISEQQKSMVNAGLAEAAENYTHEIDVHPHGWEGSPSKEAHEKGTDKMVSKMKKQGLHAKVHMYHGPGGGAAVLHLGHPKGPKHVDKWLQKNYDPDHEEGDSRINEELELTSEDYVDMLHMYIEELEGHFEAEDLQEISDTLRQNYAKKSKANLNKNWKKAGYHYNKADDAKDSSKEAKHYASGDKAMKNVAKREVGQYMAAKKLGTNFKRKTTSTYDSDHLERRGYRD